MNSQNDNKNKRFFIKTLGCKVNQYESEAMREILLKSGFKECISKEMADIYIVNTCTVTHHADKESRYLIGLLHRSNTNARIVVTGCYIEKDADDVSFLPGVWRVVRNSEKGRIADIINNPTTHDPLPNPLPITYYPLPAITDFKGRSKVFVKIQDGCDNFCSYCRVPLVRGPLRSKPIERIAEEVEGLVKNGFREIVLTGICLGAWGKDLFSNTLAQGLGLEGLSILDCLTALNKIPGVFRIRLSSIEPKYVTDKLIDFICENEKMCRHLHIPLQSGDDDILKNMNRPYKASDYRALVSKVRAKAKDMAITTDVLIGFPGESDLNFKNTVDFVKDILPSKTHIFTFSKRPGTAACNMDGEIGSDVLKRRYHKLNAAALCASYLYRLKFLNKKLDILVETKRDRHSRLLTGYSDNYIKVLFEGPDTLMKSIVPVRVTDVNLARTLGIYEG